MNVNHYPVQPGLFAGEYPGNQSPNVAETRLRELVGKGVRTFIDLTSHADMMAGLTPYEPLFVEIDGDGSLGLKRYAFEIPDMKIPSGPAVMRGILDRIREEIDGGRVCYVHCWGGIGRTGTAIGCGNAGSMAMLPWRRSSSFTGRTWMRTNFRDTLGRRSNRCSTTMSEIGRKFDQGEQSPACWRGEERAALPGP